MTAFDALLTFLMAHANLFLIVAVGAMFAGLAVGRKSRRAARVVALVSLCACAPLFVLYAVATVYRPGILSLALTALWGWNVWSSWHAWRRTRPSGPKPTPTARN